jgi:hypothetical protein
VTNGRLNIHSDSSAIDYQAAVEKAEDEVTLQHQALTEALLELSESAHLVEVRRREHARAMEHVRNLRYLLRLEGVRDDDR